jgi:hypothetical protein
VELSTGTHRVADELRRHSLSDGEGGHYSTNLDRNRYGSDNNYLFTGGWALVGGWAGGRQLGACCAFYAALLLGFLFFSALGTD